MVESQSLPVVPMRNAVLFPGVAFPISAGRAGTLRAIESALASPGHEVFAVAQREDSESVSPAGLYTIGTIATIGSVQRGLGGIRLVLDGKARGIALRYAPKKGYLEATIQVAEEMLPIDVRDPAFAGLHREARERAAELGRKLGLPEEAVQQILAEVNEPGRLADLVAGYLDVPGAEKQRLLETLSVEDRLRRVLVHVQRQIDVLSAQEDIQTKVKEEIGSRQREMYLREQLKAIQKELGEGEESEADGLKELRARLDALDLPEEARKEVDREWGRLTRIGRESMESQVIRTYLETIAELPWNERTEEKLDVARAAQTLDEDHYGLKDVKDRVLEFLAVRQLAQKREREAAKEGPELTRRSRPRRRRARARAASCSLPGRPASGRPRLRSRSPGRWDASTSASRSGERATRPTSADTGARTSGRCRDASSRE
jgi:ATP-dependent Lon protease